MYKHTILFYDPKYWSSLQFRILDFQWIGHDGLFFVCGRFGLAPGPTADSVHSEYANLNIENSWALKFQNILYISSIFLADHHTVQQFGYNEARLKWDPMGESFRDTSRLHVRLRDLVGRVHRPRPGPAVQHRSSLCGCHVWLVQKLHTLLYARQKFGHVRTRLLQDMLKCSWKEAS
jgi:hypothetical protein